MANGYTGTPVLVAVLAGALLFPLGARGQGPVPARPEMDVDRSGTPVPDGSTDNAGSQSGMFNLAYTIQNTGPGALNLTGTPAVRIAAQVGCTVSVTTQATSPVASGGSTSFTVSCTPSAGPGSPFFFNISIAGDDADENPYDWGVMGMVIGGPPPPPPGELAVDRGGAPVADGGTDNAGLITPAAAFNMTYTIQNTGAWSAIALTGTPLVLISVPVNCIASVTAQPSTPIAQSSSTTFTVSCTPTGSPFSFNISIDNTDLDENPYDWTVQGTTPLTPEMDVDRGGNPVADGATDDAGSRPAGSAFNLLYTITNTGSGTLNLTGSTIGGETNCSVSVVSPSASDVPAAGSTTFTLSCTPTNAGSGFSFTVSIDSTDADENPYDWTVSGAASVSQPPPDDGGGSCSPMPGGSAPVNVFGLLATYLTGFIFLLLARCRFRKSKGRP